MARSNLDDLVAFVAVAKERSFSRAAAQLGISPSALSHAIRGLEERLGLRLLTRTTRSVALSEAGERLLRTVGPSFDDINSAIAALSDLRERPAGAIRITTDDFAVSSLIWPKLRNLLPDYPDIKIEITTDYALTDIAAERFDAGVRLGGLVDKDMIAVPIGPDERMTAVAAPTYLAGRAMPLSPQDLTEHACINLRLPTYGGLYAWEFEKDDRSMRVRVDGQLAFNNSSHILEAVLDGFGVAYLPDGVVQPYVQAGRLVRLLADWTPPFSGYHLYYPSRRQPTPAFSVLVDALRFRN